MTGKPFFGAAADALEIVTTYKMRFMLIVGLGELITTLGRMIVMITVCFAFYETITNLPGILLGNTVMDPTYPSIFALVLNWGII